MNCVLHILFRIFWVLFNTLLPILTFRISFWPILISWYWPIIHQWLILFKADDWHRNLYKFENLIYQSVSILIDFTPFSRLPNCLRFDVRKITGDYVILSVTKKERCTLVCTSLLLFKFYPGGVLLVLVYGFAFLLIITGCSNLRSGLMFEGQPLPSCYAVMFFDFS